MLKKNKFFFFLNLKSNLLNNKYILFTQHKIINNNLIIKKLHSNKINSIFSLNWINFTNNYYYLLIFNNVKRFKSLTNVKLFILCYNGFFLNNNYLNNINNYIIFFTNNFKFYILIIYNWIMKYINIIYYIYIKFIISNLIN